VPPTTIIGIDCATQPEKTGLALALWDSGRVVLREIACGSRHDLPAAIVTRWLSGAERALLALDAPLGWPLALGRELAQHEAGQPLDADPAELFRRHTDRVIEQLLGKRPLEVGADRIARTAHAALRLLAAVAEEIGRPIPLVWGPGEFESVGVIEVYPAATRLARGVPNRPGSLAGLESEFATDLGFLEAASLDVRDAVVCTLAGADFLAGWALAPDDLALARREGWIWVRRPEGAR
jgi:hypothetical protein